MELNPHNHIVQICMQGMKNEEAGNFQAAVQLFRQAWNEATNDFERFIAAWFVARRQLKGADKLMWYEIALQLALTMNNDAVKAALPSIYLNIAQVYEALRDFYQAKQQHAMSLASFSQPSDNGPFYHGTRANLNVGDLLTAGYMSNYQSELVMNHIYFTALVNGAGLAKGDGPERVYVVEPTGIFKNDPNVTNKRFPGNPTRSYSTVAPE